VQLHHLVLRKQLVPGRQRLPDRLHRRHRLQLGRRDVRYLLGLAAEPELDAKPQAPRYHHPMGRGLTLVYGVCLVCACGRLGYDDLPLGGGADATDITSSLVARYTFDLDLLEDFTGAHAAQCEDGCPGGAVGLTGGGLAMTGGIEHLRVVDDGSFQHAGGFTITGWIRYDAIPVRTCIFTKPLGGGASNSWALCTDVDTRPFFFACDSACETVKSPTGLSTGAFVHLAGSFDGTDKRLFVDGVEVASQPGGVSFDGESLVIGGDFDSGVYGFSTQGVLDELRVYDRALAPAEIEVLAGL
jgi:hypothetical protein